MSTTDCCGISLTLLILVSLGTLSQASSRSTGFKKIHGFKHSADIFDTIHVTSAAECAVRCVSAHDCVSCNLAQATNGEANIRICELLTARGWNHSMVSAATDWTMLAGKCIILLCSGSLTIAFAALFWWTVWFLLTRNVRLAWAYEINKHNYWLGVG